MSRGLGKIQKKILDAIKSEEAVRYYNVVGDGENLELKEMSEDYKDKVGRAGNRYFVCTVKGWSSVETITQLVVNGLNCWSRADKNDDDYEPGFDIQYPTESEKQSVWRSIRQLEEKGLIESYIFPILIEEKKEKSWIYGGWYDGRKGCANRQKAICLAQ